MVGEDALPAAQHVARVAVVVVHLGVAEEARDRGASGPGQGQHGDDGSARAEDGRSGRRRVRGRHKT